MAGWVIIIVGIMYLIASVDFFIHGNYPMGFVFLCYAGSNIGLYFAANLS